MSESLAHTRRLTQLSLLIALQAVLAFTPLGFIMVPPVAITILHIPVIIGAVLMGPLYGGILGLSFGVMSMLKATFSAASPVDILFSPFISGTPLQSFIMCVIPRILLGVIAGWLFIAFHKVFKKEALAIGLSAGIATVCHSSMVLACLWLFFKAIPLWDVFVTIVSLNGLLEIFAAVLFSILVCKALFVYLRRGK